MSDIAFQVVDQACEAADQTFFPPHISMTARSTTQISTVRGWSEFPGFVSSPPKKYKTITWAGFSEQQLWLNGVQIGGARYDFSGSDTIDSSGTVTSRHVKDLSVMCDARNVRANIVCGSASPDFPSYSWAASFVGYYGTDSTFYPNLLGPTRLCSSPSDPYVSKGNAAQDSPFNYPAIDLFGFWGSSSQGGVIPCVGAANVVFNELVGESDESGTTNVKINPYIPPLVNLFEGGIPVGLVIEGVSSIITPIGPIPLPPDWTVDAQVVYENAFSATLSDEYTDSEALSHAQVIISNGTTAENNPRTTGFVSQFTNVVFTLSVTNLISGVGYVVSVDFLDTPTGTITTKQYPIVGDTTTKAVIIDSVPVPAAGHFLTVRNPRIGFA